MRVSIGSWRADGWHRECGLPDEAVIEDGDSAQLGEFFAYLAERCSFRVTHSPADPQARKAKRWERTDMLVLVAKKSDTLYVG